MKTILYTCLTMSVFNTIFAGAAFFAGEDPFQHITLSLLWLILLFVVKIRI